jgi:beta-glucosidase
MTWLPPSDTAFPAGFLWGTASSSHQAEGNNVDNDWWEWEQQPGHIRQGHRSGASNDFWHRYDDDFVLLAGLGLNQYRLSIEWSRIEPAEGRVDAGALDHYRRMLEAAHRRGITPWVNLHHFTLPRWFAAKGGFLQEENLADWRRHVERVARALMPLVNHWHPINEANAYAAGSYLVGEMPPGVRDLGACLDVLRNTTLMYRDAYQILKSIDPKAQVGTIHAFVPIHPADPESEDDRLLAKSFDMLFNDLPLRALRDGVIALPGRDPEPVAGIRGAADFFGANYYASSTLDHHRPSQLLPYPPGQARLTQVGNGVYPEGLRLVLQRVRDAGLGIPLYVTENGIGTDDDGWRIEYLAQHLHQVGLAIADGCDVRGYFHWTSVDNFEWSRGWTAQFGLIGFDPKTFARQPKPSARFLGAVARQNALRRADVEAHLK